MPQCAIYAVDPAKEDAKQEIGTAAKLLEIQNRLEFVIERMENAINHEFEKARFYSEEERKERENLHLLREQFKLEEKPLRVPLLCIGIVRGERFTEVQQRCEDYLVQGVREVWLLDPALKRAYTVTKEEGLRECRGGTLQMENPKLEMDLKTIFQ